MYEIICCEEGKKRRGKYCALFPLGLFKVCPTPLVPAPATFLLFRTWEGARDPSSANQRQPADIGVMGNWSRSPLSHWAESGVPGATTGEPGEERKKGGTSSKDLTLFKVPGSSHT